MKAITAHSALSMSPSFGLALAFLSFRSFSKFIYYTCIFTGYIYIYIYRNIGFFFFFFFINFVTYFRPKNIIGILS